MKSINRHGAQNALFSAVAALCVSYCADAQTVLAPLTVGFESGTKAGAGALSFTSDAGGVVVSTDWAATGIYSLKFPYPGQSPDDDGFTEQRFALSVAPTDLWVRFKLRVPSGYFHRDVPGSDNNKFFKMSTNPDSNSSEGVNIMWEYWPDGNGGSMLAYHWTVAGVDTGSHLANTYVFGPAESNKVLEFVLRARMSSSSGRRDGIVQTWIRPLGSGSFRQIHNETAAPLYPSSSWPTQNKWTTGYILGWANSSFGQQTNFYVDDLQMSSTSLLDSGATATTPNPPTNVDAH